MQNAQNSQAWREPRSLLVVGLLAALAASGGCETAAGTGAATGGAIGAGVGALASRCPGGALVGGLLGAGVGGLTGAAVDASREKKAERAAVADAAARAPSLDDVVRMTQAAVPPGQIAEQVRTSGAVYRLTPDNIVWLNQQGVHPSVIQAMQDSVYRTRRVYAPTTIVERPVYVVEPSPMIGVSYGRGW
jgi:hypothetical protein